MNSSTSSLTSAMRPIDRVRRQYLGFVLPIGEVSWCRNAAADSALSPPTRSGKRKRSTNLAPIS
jgi:hypothetical protein